ncbi:MAG: ADP-ribosylglycohydrolase family protein [bacterium]
MIKDKFKGCLVGVAIGDSLGAEREGSFDISENVNLSPRYTDDTAMMIGVAESLINCKGFDGEDITKRFIENYLREPWRGYGWGPPRIFNMIIKEGRSWYEMLDRKIYPGGSFGNGAAMRIAPIGLLYYDNPEKLRDIVYKSSIITHSHELAIEGAFIQAYAVSLAVKTNPPFLDKYEFLTKIKSVVKNEKYLKKIEIMEKFLKEKADKIDVIKHLGNGVEALNSVPTAIYSFLVGNSFEESVVYAVSLGGDADTIGAMSGAIAGAYYGIENIPLKWKEKLENREYIEKLAEKLWEVKAEKFNQVRGQDLL